VLVATVLVPIPAALTVDRYNAIRLAALPVFLLVLAIPALDGLVNACRRSWWARVAATVSSSRQGSSSHSSWTATERAVAARALRRASASARPAFTAGETIYVDFDDRGAQAQARWHAAARGLPDDRVVILADGGIPPVGSLVFLRFQDCDYACDEVARWEEYRLARAAGQ
jgi:hypothetical protein